MQVIGNNNETEQNTDRNLYKLKHFTCNLSTVKTLPTILKSIKTTATQSFPL